MMNVQLADAPRSSENNRRLSTVSDVIGAFESETLGVFARTSPVNEHVVLYVLATMVAVLVALAAVVKLDRVVSSVGRIVASAGSLYISPFDTSIVREVRVKTGDIVKKGQVLATLDPTFTNADVAQLQQRLASDEATVDRLGDELAGRPYLFPAKDSYRALQAGIWEKRRAEYASNLADFDGRIHAEEVQVAQYGADAKQYRNRLKLATEVEKVYQPLLSKGYVSKLQAIQATDERTEMGRLLSDAESQMSSLRQTLASLRAQRDAYIQKWHSDIGADLVTQRNDLDSTRQSLAKARMLKELDTLNAPSSAIVLKIGRISTGSVATGGGGQSAVQDPLFTLVPLDAPVEADINVDAANIGFIKVGDAVQLKLDAYRFLRHGTAKGVIQTISEGSFTTDDNNTPVAPYFKVRVSIKEVHLRNVPGDFRLVPGMTLVGDILVGRRTILSYLVEGTLSTGAEAMREP
jgi:hemolysin D